MPVTPEDTDKPQTEDECVVHDHPVPPELLARYSPDGDPDSEQDIARYVEIEAIDETVQHVELIKTEYVLGDPYEVWDVTTDKSRWWVVSNPTNLYSQKHFPSLDYTLSFHVGLMARVRSRREGPDSFQPDPFDEVLRRQNQVHERFERAIEAVDLQAVGMQLRECLLSLIAVMQRRAELPAGIERPQAANFVAWSVLVVDCLCPGDKNEKLRQYMKVTSEKTWQLVNWITHDRHANKTATSIAMHAVNTLIGHCIFLLMRERTDQNEQCPVCSSRDIRTHFEMEIEPDGDYYQTCGSCDWSNHPGLSKLA
jgi:hypothetical protein